MNPAMYEAAWKLMTKWLRNPPSGNSLHVSLISQYVSSCLTYCFPSFFGYFPYFPGCFFLFPILGLTIFGVDARKCWMKIGSGTNSIQHYPTWVFTYFMKCWMKSARLNGSKIPSNIANFACWMKSRTHWLIGPKYL